MSLGNVGKLSDGEFNKVTTLKKLGIWSASDPGDHRIDYGLSQGHGVEAKTNLEGRTVVPLAGLPPGNIGIGYTYHGVGSFGLAASKCRTDQLESPL